MLAYSHSYDIIDKGVFSSADHEKNIVEAKMTHDQAIFLMTIIAGAALNGGKRVV